MSSKKLPFVGHKKLTMAEVEERQRLAEELLLTPEMRRTNETLRNERSREGGSAQARPAAPMLILQEPSRWMLVAAAFAIFTITCILYICMVMRVQSQRAASTQVAPKVTLVSSVEPTVPSEPRSDVFMPSFPQMSAMLHGGNNSHASTLSNRLTSATPVVQSTNAQALSTYKAFWQHCRLDTAPPTPVSLSSPSSSAPSRLTSVLQTTGCSSWGSGGCRPAADSIERLHSVMALSSSAVPAPNEFMEMWVCTMGAGLVLCIMVFSLKSLMGCGQHTTAGIATDLPHGLTEAADHLSHSKTPMYTPGMVDCPDSPRVSDAARQIFLRSQAHVAALEQEREENARKGAQFRQMIHLIEEGMQRGGEQEREVRSQNRDLRKQVERLARKLDLAQSHNEMLKRELEARENGNYPLDAVSFHGPTLAQAQPTVLRNLDSLLDHTNDREGSPSGMLSPPPHSPTPSHSPTPAAINIDSPGASIMPHAIPAEDPSPPEPDSNESDASNTGTPTAISTDPSSRTPEKSDYSLDAPTFRPLASSPLQLSSKAYHTESQGSRAPRSSRSIRGRRALHAVVQPLSFSPNLNTGAASDEDEVLGTTPALPPASPAAQSTFLSRDTSTISATVGSPHSNVVRVHSRLQALASPARSSDSNVSEQPLPLLVDKHTTYVS